jgi:DNA-binding response OmpR family regulator
MDNIQSSISVHRLHRLLPSDIEKLKETVSTIGGAYSLLERFGKYILALKEPTAAELDDVTRITLQLNSAGLWDTIRPEFFIRYFNPFLSEELLNTLCAVLNVKLARAKADITIGKGDQPSLMEQTLERLGCRKEHAEVASKSHRILLVEHDASTRNQLIKELSSHMEFDTVAADSGLQAIQSTKSNEPDLVIMDLKLPDIDGFETVRRLRDSGFKAPIIMLTGHEADSDTILGLEAGANDYIAKPFRFAVLLARIRAQLRQHEAGEDAVFNIGPYTFRPSSKLLVNPRGNKVRLTEKETAILRYLYRAGQRPVSRETLLQEVWGHSSGVTSQTLDTYIDRLRRKVEKETPIPPILVSVAGGYKLTS